jgi:hypothetical protein
MVSLSITVSKVRVTTRRLHRNQPLANFLNSFQYRDQLHRMFTFLLYLDITRFPAVVSNSDPFDSIQLQTVILHPAVCSLQAALLTLDFPFRKGSTIRR